MWVSFLVFWEVCFGGGVEDGVEDGDFVEESFV